MNGKVPQSPWLRIKLIGLHKQSHRQYRKQVLRDKEHLNYLSELHEKYVLVPADKAANNVLVVCKKYYLEVVIKELNNNNKTGPKTCGM